MSECNSVEKTYQKNRLNGVKDYNKKRIWNRCHNMSEGKKQKLKEYQKIAMRVFLFIVFSSEEIVLLEGLFTKIKILLILMKKIYQQITLSDKNTFIKVLY